MSVIDSGDIPFYLSLYIGFRITEKLYCMFAGKFCIVLGFYVWVGLLAIIVKSNTLIMKQIQDTKLQKNLQAFFLDLRA